MQGGDQVLEDLMKDRDGGMPWMVILDGDGAEIISSTGPKGNIGCPVADHEIEYFVEMIKASSNASDDKLATIDAAMKAYAQQFR